MVSYDQLLKVFWEAHEPTRGAPKKGVNPNPPGNYPPPPETKPPPRPPKKTYEQALRAASLGAVTTEILDAPAAFYYAEDYHQQYLAKNPDGYCGLGGTGVACRG